MSAAASPSPEIPKTHRRHFRVAHRVLDVAVAKVCLQGARVGALVGKLKAAGMPQHVRVGRKSELSCHARSRHDLTPAGGRKW
jgi:hypothetical protein